ncbi:MAG: diacylglycerol kinase family protein [Nitrospirota bacterium]
MKSLIVIISNPVAKKASEKKISIASNFLKSKGYKVEIFSTKKRGDAENFARNAITESPHLIIAAGGDGTFNEVANGIAGSETPMAILPLGTTNVLAKETGIPENVEKAMEIAVSNTPKTISLGKISCLRENQITHQQLPITRYFILMAGIGFDAEAVFGINENIKKVSGKGAYIYSGFKVLLNFKPSDLAFDIDGKIYSGSSAVIGNTAKYGGNFKITPDARLSEPNLCICLFKGKKRGDILRYVIGILTKSHLRFNDIEYLKANRIQINGNSHIQIDGDYLGMTPAKVEIAPDVLRLVF